MDDAVEGRVFQGHVDSFGDIRRRTGEEMVGGTYRMVGPNWGINIRA